MKLSEVQNKIAKSVVLYAIGVIVVVPIFKFIFDKPVSWKEVLISTSGILTGGLIVGLFLLFASSDPSKKDK